MERRPQILNTKFKRCSELSCRRRNMLLSLNCYYKHSGSRYGRRAICKDCFHKKYGDKYEKYRTRRNKNLNHQIPLTDVEIMKIREAFHHKCAITGEEEEVSLDHFVPLSWGDIAIEYGIGGNTYANMLPISIFLNKSKSYYNPFEWFSKAAPKHNLDVQKWNDAVEYVANKHKMTSSDYERRVNECAIQVKTRSSIYSLNKAINQNRFKPPYYLLRHLLQKGVVLEVAVQKYGYKKTKQFLKGKEVESYIDNYKVELTKRVNMENS